MNIEFAALWRSRSSLIHCSNTARLAHNDSVRRSVSYISQQIILNLNPFHPPSPTRSVISQSTALHQASVVVNLLLLVFPAHHALSIFFKVYLTTSGNTEDACGAVAPVEAFVCEQKSKWLRCQSSTRSGASWTHRTVCSLCLKILIAQKPFEIRQRLSWAFQKLLSYRHSSR